MGMARRQAQVRRSASNAVRLTAGRKRLIRHRLPRVLSHCTMRLNASSSQTRGSTTSSTDGLLFIGGPLSCISCRRYTNRARRGRAPSAGRAVPPSSESFWFTTFFLPVERTPGNTRKEVL